MSKYRIFSLLLIVIIGICLCPVSVCADDTTYHVYENSDDGYVYGTTLNNTDVSLYMGKTSVGVDSYMRYTLISIPETATITSAHLIFKSNSSQSGTVCSLRIQAWDTANATALSTAAQYNAADRTLSYVDWTVGAWVSGTSYNSPDISTVIQEVISRPDWYEDSNIMIFVQNNGSSASAQRLAVSRDNDELTSVGLYVEWTDGPPSPPEPPSDFSVVRTGYDTALLSWVNISPFVRIYTSEGNYPYYETGYLIYEGIGESCNITGVFNYIDYYFTAWGSYDGEDYSDTASGVILQGDDMNVSLDYNSAFIVLGIACFLLALSIFLRKPLLMIALFLSWWAVVATVNNPWIDGTAGVIMIYSAIQFLNIRKQSGNSGV